MQNGAKDEDRRLRIDDGGDGPLATCRWPLFTPLTCLVGHGLRSNCSRSKTNTSHHAHETTSPWFGGAMPERGWRIEGRSDASSLGIASARRRRGVAATTCRLRQERGCVADQPQHIRARWGVGERGQNKPRKTPNTRNQMAKVFHSHGSQGLRFHRHRVERLPQPLSMVTGARPWRLIRLKPSPASTSCRRSPSPMSSNNP